MSFLLRKAMARDVDGVQQCALAAYEKYVGRIGRKPAPMIADFATQVSNDIVDVAQMEDGSIGGFMVYYSREAHLHIENIAVLPRHQGEGIGKALLLRAEAFARQSNINIIELYTHEKMTENTVFYPRQGYIEIDRRSEDGFDRIYYRKTI